MIVSQYGVSFSIASSSSSTAVTRQLPTDRRTFVMSPAPVQFPVPVYSYQPFLRHKQVLSLTLKSTSYSYLWRLSSTILFTPQKGASRRQGWPGTYYITGTKALPRLRQTSSSLNVSPSYTEPPRRTFITAGSICTLATRLGLDAQSIEISIRRLVKDGI